MEQITSSKPNFLTFFPFLSWREGKNVTQLMQFLSVTILAGNLILSPYVSKSPPPPHQFTKIISNLSNKVRFQNVLPAQATKTAIKFKLTLSDRPISPPRKTEQ